MTCVSGTDPEFECKSVGQAGLVSYSVTRRRAEIGVRAALGATPDDLVRLVMRDVLRVTLGGLAFGSIFCLVGGRLLTTMLYGIKPDDLTTVAIASGTLTFVAVIAGYIPARRAARIDAIECLHSE
jgi:ABC-type antimicrobial peptide transport system permease subunit